MIIVNISVPALEKTYNFSVEEKAQVGDLIDEIALLVYQKEGLAFEGDPKVVFQEMALCSLDKDALFDRLYSLADYGVCDGSELLLV